MTQVGTASLPLRVAVIGSGPAAFYAAECLFKQQGLVVEVDMFERLPTPYGLVRHGVAPDHAKIKTVTRAYDAVAGHPRFRFFGNVDYGRHLTLDDLRAYYHQVVFATGAQTDRRMGIPGEDLPGSHPATEFVAWYNGHPDYRACSFDLSVERAAVVGVGNVAIDVARILARTAEELEKTDIAGYALEALRASRITEVFLLGRRGPVQAAFTTPEVKEIGEMADADVIVRPEEVQLDPLSGAQLEASDDRLLARKVEILQGYALRKPEGKRKRLTLRFLVSPVELVADERGRVAKMRLVRNTLVGSEAGAINARPTGEFEEIDVGLVFRSVGYRGVPLPGLPFDDRAGVVPNDKGRVLDAGAGRPLTGVYAAGWIKRGPSGVIGTNKPDAAETVAAMVADLAAGAHWQPSHPDPDAAAALVQLRQPFFVSYDDWRRLDALEIENGKACGRPRLKFTSVEEMLVALGRTVPAQ
ncbi:MAG TPA: FAD-dependent oxidoreductase [Vicinamibacterales bacterium]|nr:FAD-dependent oxidoreductase [Vicinamibacterales bacterium]